MYEYRYAVGRFRGYQPGHQLVDISKYKLSDVASNFSFLDIVIYDDFYKRLVKITLDDYYDTFAHYAKSIVDFLKENGNKVLNYQLKIPKNEYVYGRWESIFHKAFYIHPGNVNLSNDSQSKLTADAAPDIRIVRDNVDYTGYKNLSDYSLFIMNGCFVRAVGNNNGIFLIGAGRDFQKIRQDMYVSAIDFERIGKIKTIPITKTMLRRATEGGANRFFFDLNKNENLTNKTIWFVFNGQLCVDEDVISHIGSNTLQFRPEYIDMSKHYFTYSQYTRTAEWTDQSKRDRYAEDSIVMDNSFVIIIDNPTVGISIDPLIMSKWPSAGLSNETFQHPIMLENGLFPYTNRRKYGFKDRLVHFDIHHQYLPVLDSVGNLSTDKVYDLVNNGQMGKLPDAFEFKITGITYE